MTKPRNACLTSYAEELINKSLKEWTTFCETNTKHIRFLVLQAEECPKTKRTHLQIYCELYKQKGIAGWKKLFTDKAIHIESRKGTQEQAIVYCQKEETQLPGTQFQWGEPKASKQGDRTDLHDAFDDARNLDLTLMEVAENNIPAFMRYNRAIEKVRGMQEQLIETQKLVERYKDCQLRDWQKEIQLILETEPDSRAVYWICDTTGNTGKSWFADWAEVFMEAQVFTNGGTRDIALAYNNKPVVIFDLSRTEDDRINYTVLEQIKNGRIWSPKYESKMKRFTPPHLIVFANQWPDVKKMSEDRWTLYELKKNTLFVKLAEDVETPAFGGFTDWSLGNVGQRS